MGLEPTTFGVTSQRSNQLSYKAIGTAYCWLASQGSNLEPPHSECGALPIALLAIGGPIVLSRMRERVPDKAVTHFPIPLPPRAKKGCMVM